MRTAAAIAAMLLVASSAHADECRRDRPNAISISPLGIIGHGLSAQYERLVEPPRLSIVGIVGLRSGASYDYSSWTMSLGVEARYWMVPSRPCKGPIMDGPYVGMRLSVGYTTVTDDVTRRHVGSSFGVAPSLMLGWRFTPFDVVEITPAIGLGQRVDIDPRGRLGAFTRGTIVLGLTVGVMF